MKRIKKRFIVDLSYTDRQVCEGALTEIIRRSVKDTFHDDNDITVDKVGQINRVIGIEKAKAKRIEK